MPRKKINLSELTDSELNEKLKEDRAQSQRLRFNHAVSHIENPTRIRQMRKDIARINTEIRRRQMESTK